MKIIVPVVTLTLSFFLAITVNPVSTKAASVTISGVPAYTLYHGCGPTSVGMIMGYYDIHGFPNLFSVQGNAVYQTSNVQDEISSPMHNAKYDYTDNPTLPTPPNTSIADFLGTSVDPLIYGDTWIDQIEPGIVNYAAYKGYVFKTSDMQSLDTIWSTLVNEVNNNRPMLFIVTTDTYDARPVFGYDDRGAEGKWYACYDNFSENETPVWKRFQGTGDSGVYGAIQITAVPEPATLSLLVFGGSMLLFRHKKPSR